MTKLRTIIVVTALMSAVSSMSAMRRGAPHTMRRDMMPAMHREIRTCDELNETLNNPARPSLFYIHASWCGPCQQMGDVIKKVQSQFANRLDVYWVDYEQLQGACAALGVDGLPRMIFARKGEERIIQKGARSEDKFLADTELFLENKLQQERERTNAPVATRPEPSKKRAPARKKTK